MFENEVAVFTFKGDYLLSDVEPIGQMFEQLMNDKPYQQIVLMLSPDHKIENRETREAAIRNLRFADYVAIVGGGAVNRMVAKVMLKTGVVRMKGEFFKTYEEAVSWLKSKR